MRQVADKLFGEAEKVMFEKLADQVNEAGDIQHDGSRRLVLVVEVERKDSGRNMSEAPQIAHQVTDHA